MSSHWHPQLGADASLGAGSAVLVLLGAYFVGSIPFGLLAGKLRGLDIREHGSGNIGATNALRTLGKPWGLTVFALDFLKGFFPVYITSRLAADDNVLPLVAAVCAILGHNYPVWLKFKGGKGIATSGGALVGVLPWAVLSAVLTWLVGFATTRYVSVASMAAALAIPITTGVLVSAGHAPLSHFIFGLLIAGLAIWRHRGNLRRLRAGTEPRFSRGRKRKTTVSPNDMRPS